MRSFGAVTRANLVVLLGAAVIAGPLLLYGSPWTDSVTYNMVWAKQFAVLMREGEIYPRWMPLSFDGLGSPAFLFYAPLPFQLMGVLDMLSFDTLGMRRLVGLYCALAIAASGFAMRAWLRRRAVEPAATLGAVLYMAAPYHLLDVYVRGSIGEVAAYAILPMLMAASDDVLARRSGATLRFGLWTGLLLLSHLPSALAIGAFTVPGHLAFGIASGWTSWRCALWTVMRAVAGGLLGLAFAAVYVVPALLLLDIASMNYLTDGYYDARHWLLIRPAAWPVAHLYGFVASVAAGFGLLCAGLLHWARRADARADVFFWAGLAFGLLVLMSGIVPGIWHPSSPMARMEFPWRLLLPAEFAGITAAAWAGSVWMTRRGFVLFGAVLVCFVPALTILLVRGSVGFAVLQTPAWQRLEAASATVYPDALEYLPRGHNVTYDAGGQSLEQFRALVAPHSDRRLVRSVDGSARVEALPGSRGGMLLLISATDETRIVLRRFHYPLWRLIADDGASGPRLEAFGPDRLLSFVVPAGESRLRLVWSPPPAVGWGAALTLGSLFVMAMMLWWSVSRRAP